jgi:hypothetical protein
MTSEEKFNICTNKFGQKIDNLLIYKLINSYTSIHVYINNFVDVPSIMHRLYPSDREHISTVEEEKLKLKECTNKLNKIRIINENLSIEIEKKIVGNTDGKRGVFIYIREIIKKEN